MQITRKQTNKAGGRAVFTALLAMCSIAFFVSSSFAAPEDLEGLTPMHSAPSYGYASSDAVSATGDLIVGVLAADHGSFDVKGGIELTGNDSVGAFAENGSHIAVSGDVKLTGDNTYGIFASKDATVDVDGKVEAGCGVKATEGSNVRVTGDILVESDFSTGVIAHISSVTVNGDITMAGGGNGLYLQTLASADITGNIVTNGGTPLHVSGGSLATIHGDITSKAVETGGDGAYVMLSSLDLYGNITNDNSGNEGRGDGGDSYVDGLRVEGNYHLDEDTAVANVTGNVTTNGDYARTLHATNSGRIDISGDVTANGKGSAALYTYVKGKINMANGTITVPDDTSWHIVFARGGTINLDNVTAGGDGNLNLLKTVYWDGALTAKKSTLIGDVMREEETYPLSPLSIQLSDNSVWTGKVMEENKDVIDLGIDNSRWNVTGDSSTKGALTMGDNSMVDFAPSQLGTKVTVSSLSGNGSFAMKTDIANQTADRLIVEKTTDGSHKLNVTNNGSAATTGEELTTLVETADKGGDFTLENDTVDAGAWTYALRKADSGLFDGGQSWELYGVSQSNPGETAVDTFIGTYYMNYAETDNLMKRLGDLRGNAEHGAWFRGFGGKMESDGREYAGNFDMDYWGMQIGYDNKLDRDKSWLKNGDTYVGAFIGTSNGDMDLGNNSGSGSLENRSMGMYATYVGDNGVYLDTVAKYVWSKNEFTAHDSANTLVQGGRMNTGGVGLSFETGKRIRLGGNTGRGNWYAEPQVQLSWQHMGGGTFHADNGLDIGVKGFDSLIGRVGALIGYESKNTNIYAKVSCLKEFDGDMDVDANDVIIHDGLDDDWIVYGIGMTRQMNDRSSFYLDLERTAGGDFDLDWNVNAGWRISF